MFPGWDRYRSCKLLSWQRCAGLSAFCFCIALRKSKQFYEHVFPGKISRVIVGGLIIVGLTYLVGNNLYNGDSIGLIGAAVKHLAGIVTLWKIAFTSLTISAGFKGGEIVPTFVVGATFGSFAGNLLGLSPSMGAGVGLVAVFFCGAVNCPLTAFVLGLEVFGSGAGLFFLLACAVSYVFRDIMGSIRARKYGLTKCGRHL